MRAALALAILVAAAPASAQEVIVGTSAHYPPIIVHNGSPPVTGLEGDLVSLICARAGWTCRWQIMPFDAVFPALETGQIDIAANSLGYTAERAARVHMTCPYRPMGEAGNTGTFYVRDPEHDARSGPIAVLRGTLHATALEAEGLDLRPFATDAAALDAVIAGTLPAYFGPDPAVDTHPGRAHLRAAGRMDVPSGGTSLAVSRTRPDLAAEVDAQLATLSREGIIATLIQTWTGDGGDDDGTIDDPIALCDIGLPIS